MAITSLSGGGNSGLTGLSGLSGLTGVVGNIDPASISGYLSQFDADLDCYTDVAHTTACSLNGDPVRCWRDQNGFAHDLTNTVGAGVSPEFKPTGGPNSHKSVYFNKAGSERINTSAFTFNQPATVFLVLKQITWTSNLYIMDGVNTDGMALAQRNASPELRIGASPGVCAVTDQTLNTWYILSAQFNGASSYLRTNLNARQTGNVGAVNPGGIYLGCRANVASFGDFHLTRAYFFNTAVSDSNADGIINFLNGIYQVF